MSGKRSHHADHSSPGVRTGPADSTNRGMTPRRGLVEEQVMDRAADRGAAACAGSPSFLITIDTEGDNLWSRPREITTGNARYLPRFQALCEKYGLKPTYLTN